MTLSDIITQHPIDPNTREQLDQWCKERTPEELKAITDDKDTPGYMRQTALKTLQQVKDANWNDESKPGSVNLVDTSVNDVYSGKAVVKAESRSGRKPARRKGKNPPHRPKRENEIPETKIAKLLIKHHGMMYAVARELGCDGSNIAHRCERSEYLKKVKKDAREWVKDKAELNVVQRVIDDDWQATKFYLKTQAKDRGYIERDELAGVPDQPLQIHIGIAGENDVEVNAEYEIEDIRPEE